MRHTYEAGAGQWSTGETAKALGDEKHHVRGNCQQQGYPAGKLCPAIRKGHSHLLTALNVPDTKVA
jgi:hypothetical protein